LHHLAFLLLLSLFLSLSLCFFLSHTHTHKHTLSFSISLSIQAEREIFDDEMTHCACSPGFARLVQRALQENKADLYESAEAMLKDNEMHEAIKLFDTDMKKAIEAQEAMMKELLDKHAHTLGELQMENEQCKQTLMATREQMMSVQKISDDEEDPESINVRETRLLQEAEAGRVKLADEMDAMARAQAEVKRQLLAQHQQEHMRMQENMRIELEEWTRMQQQMQKDVNEFATKVIAERERRTLNPKKLSEAAQQALIDFQETKLKKMVVDEEKKRMEEEEELRAKVANWEREKRERMSELQKKMEAVFSEDTVLPEAQKFDVREGKQARMIELQKNLDAVFSSDFISPSASEVAGGAESLEKAVDAASGQEDLQDTKDRLAQQESEEEGAGVGGAIRMKTRSERMLDMRQKLAAVFPDNPVSLLTPSSVSLATAGGEEVGSVGGGGRAVDGASERNLPGRTDDQSELESPQNFSQSLQRRPSHQEALVSKSFVAVLPYSVGEFTADLQLKYRQAVAETACVGIDQVFFLPTLSRARTHTFIYNDIALTTTQHCMVINTGIQIHDLSRH